MPNYQLDQTETGVCSQAKVLKIIMGVDGTEEEEDETFDDLYLTNPDTNERKHIARAFRIVVLGWARK